MVLRRLMSGVKDGALSISLKSFLNDRFHDFGEVLDCEVDTRATRLQVHVRLKGETEPITAAIERYEIKDTPDGRVVVLHKFSTSREWITKLLTRIFSGKQYKLPSAVSKLL
jgi:hypothetical protein